MIFCNLTIILVHERDLDIDFSLVVIKHLLNKEAEGFNFKLILMSATFNIELFSNYFSKSSIRSIEQLKTYVGVEEMMRKQEEEKQRKIESMWGPCKAEQWGSNSGSGIKGEDDEDKWVENNDAVEKNSMPIPK